MILSSYLLINFAAILLIKLLIRRRRLHNLNLPRGPGGLPLVGNLFQLLLSPHTKFSEWAKTYGKMYTINLAGTPALLVNDVKTMKEVFGTLASTGKFQLELFTMVLGKEVGVGNSEGSVWQEQQQFLLKALKQFGFTGGSKLESEILFECDQICTWISKKLKVSDEIELNLSQRLFQLTTSVTWYMLSGETHSVEIAHLLESWTASFNTASKSGLLFMPWLKYIVPKISGYSDCVQKTNELHALVQKSFDAHKSSLNFEHDNLYSSDLIEAYLRQVNKCTDTSSTFYGEMGIKHSFMSVMTMLGAGSETTASSINWLIHYVLAYPDVQKKVHEEIDAVVGKERSPTLQDKRKMPYLEAVVLEALRVTSLDPFGIIHKLLDDVKYEEYILPKGMLLFANIYYANNDPFIWKDPENFRPERFLEGSEADKKRLRDCVASFQEGLRKCPGENLAKELMFLVGASLLQKFSFHPRNGKNADEYLKAVTGYMLLPPKIDVLIRNRKQEN